jgi:tetratricopeptide (TPR) repeat protein
MAHQATKRTDSWGASALHPLALILLFSVPAIPCCAHANATPKHPTPNPLSESEKVLLQGRADDAVARLQTLIAANPQDGRAHLLLCRAFYAEELTDRAITECEAALATQPNDSKTQDWMGRAYGQKADRSGPFAGYKLASKVRASFETAVQLDPRNDDAVNDLGEYYVSAPPIVGGGVEKALALANRAEPQLPQTAHRIRALAAEKQHDNATAENEFKAAAAVADHPDAWFDLGHFYFRRNQKDQAIEALHHAIDVDRAHGPALVDVASILARLHTQTDVAENVLRTYLASNAKTDAAPAFKAYVELGHLLEGDGDKQGAQTQFQTALALAHDYAPAKKAIQHP